MVLAAALAVFVVAGLPLVGFAFAAGVWLIQRGVQELAARRSEEALRNGNRQRALGLIAGTTLGRVWLMVTGALLAGLIDHESGLAAAVLLVILFTVSFAAGGLAHLFRPEPEGKIS